MSHFVRSLGLRREEYLAAQRDAERIGDLVPDGEIGAVPHCCVIACNCHSGFAASSFASVPPIVREA